MEDKFETAEVEMRSYRILSRILFFPFLLMTLVDLKNSSLS